MTRLKNQSINILFLMTTMFLVSNCGDDDDETEIVTASFEVATTDLAADAAIEFTNTSENATYYVWNFGDGNASSDENPSHTYDSAGTYTVSLIAIGGSSSDTAKTSIEVDASNVTIFPGEGITDVKLYETTWSEIKSLYGTDTTMILYSEESGDSITYYYEIGYEDLGIYFYIYSKGLAKLYDDAYVYGIILWSPLYEGTTSKGIGMGSTGSDITEAYGDAEYTSSGTYSGSITYTYYEYSSIGIAFYDLSSNYNVYQINIFYTSGSSSSASVENIELSNSFLENKKLKVKNY